MKKTIHQLILMILLTLTLTACESADQPAGENPNAPEATPTTALTLPAYPGTEETAAPLNTPTPLADLGPDELPVAVSYIEEIDGQRIVISTGLNFPSDYATISIPKEAFFHAQAAIDGDLNLYIFYGYQNNYFSKLSVDGTVETIEIPFRWEVQTRWVGNQLFVLAKEPLMAVINPDLSILSLSPAINILEDGSMGWGSLGVTNDPSPEIIWVASHPVEDETGDYAFYRTLSLETFTTTEHKLAIPDSDWNWAQANPNAMRPGQRLGTIVYGVDTQNDNVFLCYNYKKVVNENQIFSKMELYASKTGETITAIDFPCLNRVYDIRGNAIVSMRDPVSGGVVLVLGLNDLQPIFDFGKYFDIKHYYENWIGTNGVYWQILSRDKITVLNGDLEEGISYPMPPNLPAEFLPGSFVVPAFLIED